MLGSKRQACLDSFFGKSKVQKVEPPLEANRPIRSPTKLPLSQKSKGQNEPEQKKETASIKPLPPQKPKAEDPIKPKTSRQVELGDLFGAKGKNSQSGLLELVESEAQELDQKYVKAARTPQFGKAAFEGIQDGKLNIWSWNINGFNANVERKTLKLFIEKEDPDILCLNETKTDLEKIAQKQFYKEIPAGYEQYWNCSKTRKGYSGVAIFSKVKPVRVWNDLLIEKHDDEGRVITAEFERFFLVAVYVPNAGDGLKRHKYRTQEWDVDFTRYLKELERTKPVVLTGDLNVAHTHIDLFEPRGREKMAGFTLQERENFSKLLSMQFVDTFRHFYPSEVKFSFWGARGNNRPKNKGWRLDYFVVSQAFVQESVEDSTIHGEYMGSDHCPIQIKLRFK